MDSVTGRSGRYELNKDSSVDSKTSNSSGGSKLRSCEVFALSRIDEATEEEPLNAKRCRLRKSRHYDGYGLVLKYQQHLHVIDKVEEDSPSYRAGLRENDVIVFVGKKNVEKVSHDDVKVLIQATALGADHVELLVLSKLDVPRYKKLQEKGLIDWATMELEKWILFNHCIRSICLLFCRFLWHLLSRPAYCFRKELMNINERSSSRSRGFIQQLTGWFLLSGKYR